MREQHKKTLPTTQATEGASGLARILARKNPLAQR